MNKKTVGGSDPPTLNLTEQWDKRQRRRLMKMNEPAPPV